MLDILRDSNGKVYPIVRILGYLCVCAIFALWLFVFLPEDTLITFNAYLNFPTNKVNPTAIGWAISILPSILTVAGFYIAMQEHQSNPTSAGLWALTGFVSMAVDIGLDIFWKKTPEVGWIWVALDVIVFFTLFSEVLAVSAATYMAELFGDFWEAWAEMLRGGSRAPQNRHGHNSSQYVNQHNSPQRRNAQQDAAAFQWEDRKK